MSQLIITGIVGIIGTISTIVAWNLNPSRIKQERLDNATKELIQLYEKRDKALKSNDSDNITSSVIELFYVKKRIADILQR